MLFHIKRLLDVISYPLYVARGRKPWTPGYYTAKRLLIEKAIDNEYLKYGSTLPTKYGLRLDERVIEYPWVYSRLPKNPGFMLDAGSALNHDFLIRRPPVSNAKLAICTLAPEKRCYWKRGISYVYDDLRESIFRSEIFNTIVSISTIEHIGLDNTLLYTNDSNMRETSSAGYRAAIREFRRIIRSGGECYITVPYGKAKVCGWYQVFDSSMVQVILDEFKPSSQEIEYFGYNRDGWKSVTPSELSDATFYDVHQSIGLDPDLAAGARGIVCMRLFA